MYFIDHGVVIAITTLESAFACMGNEQCSVHFLFLRVVVDGVSEISVHYTTKQNTSSTSRILSTFISLKRLSTPQRSADQVVLLRKHMSHMSGMVWETMERFIEEGVSLIMSPIEAGYTEKGHSTWK